jgi:hypothetical protein
LSPSIHSRVLPYLLSVESVVKSELNCDPKRKITPYLFGLTLERERERESVANCSFVFLCSYNQFLRLPKKKKKKEKRKDSKEKKGAVFHIDFRFLPPCFRGCAVVFLCVQARVSSTV